MANLPEKKVFNSFSNPSKKKYVFGDPYENPRTLYNFEFCGNGEKGKFIREIRVKTSLWDDRTLVSGLSIKWSNDDGKDQITEAGGGDVAAELVVPEGEHIGFVYGSTGQYVDSLSFVLSDGTLLGKTRTAVDDLVSGGEHRVNG